MGRDYSPSNGTITFSPAILQQIINITIIDDESVEDIEMFIVHLSGAPTNVILSPSQASVAIIDNDDNDNNDGRYDLLFCIALQWHYFISA